MSIGVLHLLNLKILIMLKVKFSYLIILFSLIQQSCKNGVEGPLESGLEQDRLEVNTKSIDPSSAKVYTTASLSDVI